MTTPTNGRPVDSRPVSFTDLETEFPGWRIWQPPGGQSWWATRLGSTWTAPRTLAADTEVELRAELRAAGEPSTDIRERARRPGIDVAWRSGLADVLEACNDTR